MNLSVKGLMNLHCIAWELQQRSPNGCTYKVDYTYLDYPRLAWKTIICTRPNGDSWQVLNPRDWQDIAAAEVEELPGLIERLMSSEFFLDK
jgi:hypothetical protein